MLGDLRESLAAKHLLHKIQHDSLGDHVNHGSLDDVIVRGDEELCTIISIMS
jgi:hypothetical protein